MIVTATAADREAELRRVASRREELAKAAHDLWAHWMRYQFSQCHALEDGSLVIPADKVNRWQRQANTEYEDLSEDEKRSDREVVAFPTAEQAIAAKHMMEELTGEQWSYREYEP